MDILITSFLVASICSYLIVISAHRFPFTKDGTAGPQKAHPYSVPRVGGIAIVTGMFAVILQLLLKGDWPTAKKLAVFMGCGMFVFGIGLLEDVTKNIGPRTRLVVTMFAVCIAFFAMDAALLRVDIPWFDHLLQSSVAFSLVCTVIAVAGLSHSLNIIDGYNGLASMVALIILSALGYISYTLNSWFLFQASVAMAGSVLGFLVWNYPHGHILVGDGGAYLMGFVIGEISVLLVSQHAEVSALFPLLLVAYPVSETLFTIYRRKILRGLSPATPDTMHLHSLIYHRLIRTYRKGRKLRRDKRKIIRRNYMTSPYLWGVTIMTTIPAIFLWNNTRMLYLALLAFVIFYVWVYRRIVLFKSPGWLILELGEISRLKRALTFFASLKERLYKGSGPAPEVRFPDHRPPTPDNPHGVRGQEGDDIGDDLFSDPLNVGSTLIYGAGNTGRQIILAWRQKKVIGKVLALIDDDKLLSGQKISGIKVYPPEKLSYLIERNRPQSIIMALPSTPQNRRAEILSYLEPFHLRTLFTPDAYDQTHDSSKIHLLRPIKLEDLIDRVPTTVDHAAITALVQDRALLVTGAGGAVGSELCRQIIKFAPRRLILLDFSEDALGSIFFELQNHTRKGVDIVPILGSAHHYRHIKEILHNYEIQNVFHAASYKMAPTSERNVIPFIENNIIGLEHIIKGAVESQTEQFVLVSSKHAEHVHGILGSTQRFAEMVLQSYGQSQTHTIFSCIRLGQTMSSSLMPQFHEQLNRRDPIHLSEPSGICYPMSLTEAVQLIFQSATMSRGGELFAIRMEEPKRVVDLAYRMAHLSGMPMRIGKYTKENVGLHFTGLDTDVVGVTFSHHQHLKTTHDMIMLIPTATIPWPQMHKELSDLTTALDNFNGVAANEVIQRVVNVLESS
ncbi:MAG: polysaccharide biosynthesis protein [Magnetococcales bacterium]|nr:polysaccharide biosynthesis protein [Magnetococcales bacterium]